MATEAPAADASLTTQAPAQVAGEAEGTGAPGIAPAVPPPAESSEPVVVRMRGLPWQADASAVAKWVAPVEVAPESVHFIMNNVGRPSGDCIVVLRSQDEAAAVIAKHRELMGTRYIEVFKSTAQEMKECLVQPEPPPVVPELREADMSSMEPCIRMRGLPFGAAIPDVEAFFEGLPLLKGGIYIMIGVDGRPLGEAFVQFETPEAVTSALERNRSLMGTRYIELFGSTKGEMAQKLAQLGRGARSVAGAGSYNGLGTGEEEAVVRLRGLPFTATAADIAAFFSQEPAVAVAFFPQKVQERVRRPTKARANAVAAVCPTLKFGCELG